MYGCTAITHGVEEHTGETADERAAEADDDGKHDVPGARDRVGV